MCGGEGGCDGQEGSFRVDWLGRVDGGGGGGEVVVLLGPLVKHVLCLRCFDSLCVSVLEGAKNE